MLMASEENSRNMLIAMLSGRACMYFRIQFIWHMMFPEVPAAKEIS
jgi:hypothetical protein